MDRGKVMSTSDGKYSIVRDSPGEYRWLRYGEEVSWEPPRNPEIAFAAELEDVRVALHCTT